MAITTGRASLAFLAPRNRFASVKPTRECFSHVGPFPKTRIIVPPLASSSLNRLFAPRLSKPLTTSRATVDDHCSIPPPESDKLIGRWFPPAASDKLTGRGLPMFYSFLAFMWMSDMHNQLPLYVMFQIFATSHLDAVHYFFPSSNFDHGLMCIIWW